MIFPDQWRAEEHERGGGQQKKLTDRFDRRYLMLAYKFTVKSPDFIFSCDCIAFVTKLDIIDRGVGSI